MTQDRKTHLRELLSGFPLNAEMRESKNREIERMGPEEVEETIARLEEASKELDDALKNLKPALEAQRKALQEALQKDPALWLRRELRGLLAYYLLGPEANQEALRSISAMSPEEVGEAVKQVREAIALLPEDDRDYIERVIEAGFGVGIWLTPAEDKPK